jgi:hypothetical protein
VRQSLTTLPWVEPDSIVTEPKTRQVRFTLKDRNAFDEEAVKTALGTRYARRLKLLTGPTDS